MSITTSQSASLTLPEIAASDLEAARRFLAAGSEEVVRPRATNFVHARKAPTVHNGIARARFRSAGRKAD